MGTCVDMHQSVKNFGYDCGATLGMLFRRVRILKCVIMNVISENPVCNNQVVGIVKTSNE